jgi:hypothetical protein
MFMPVATGPAISWAAADGIRSAAYILNLTRVWSALNFLKVPQLHFVTAPRLSVAAGCAGAS